MVQKKREIQNSPPLELGRGQNRSAGEKGSGRSIANVDRTSGLLVRFHTEKKSSSKKSPEGKES